MNKLSLLVSVTLIILSSYAKAEEASADDLRYCLGLRSNYEIAKCAGEISAGSKGKPYTKEEVDKMLSEQPANMPPTPIESSEMSGAPAESSHMPAAPIESSERLPAENQIKDMLLEQDEGSNN